MTNAIALGCACLLYTSISDKDLNLMSFNDYKKIMENYDNKSEIEGHLQWEE